MSVKTTLKTIKLNESVISMILGAVVIVVSGLLVVNLLNNRQTNTALPTGEVAETDDANNETITRDGNTIHIVQENDNLWKIAERYYESGYNWVDIAEANNLQSSDSLAAGQELAIPNVDPRSRTIAAATETSPTPISEQIVAGDQAESTLSITSSPSPTPTNVPEIAQGQPNTSENMTTQSDTAGNISGSTYTVVSGDTLWDIAQRAYGDPYRWTDISEANNLPNPDLIHPGNVFSIPR